MYTYEFTDLYISIYIHVYTHMHAYTRTHTYAHTLTKNVLDFFFLVQDTNQKNKPTTVRQR